MIRLILKIAISKMNIWRKNMMKLQSQGKKKRVKRKRKIRNVKSMSCSGKWKTVIQEEI